MRPFQKPLIVTALSIVLFIAGFFLLLRGCLSRYDERSAITPALYFKNASQEVIFTIVKFQKATSYSQKDGFTSKTVSTNYFVQINDAEGSAKIMDRKVRHQHDLRDPTVEILGASGNQAWVFIGELMAFDPFTLHVKADKNIIERANPFIKGKLPVERRYYQFNKNGQLHFIASNGTPYILNTTTLFISNDPHPQRTDALPPALQEIKDLKDINHAAIDTLFAKQYRDNKTPGGKPSLRSHENYAQVTTKYIQQRTRLYRERDSLEKIECQLEKKNRAKEAIQRKIQSLAGRSSVYFNQAKSNLDSLDGRWYGLYTSGELDKIDDRFDYSTIYDETGRRQFFSGAVIKDKNDEIIIQKDSIPSTSPYFLDGGFLLDKYSGKPFHLPGALPFLVIYKNQLGSAGRIQVSRVGKTGSVAWTFNTQLKEWSDWLCVNNRLYIFGTNNSELSSGEVNLLWTIDLNSGKASSYDYFNDSRVEISE